MEFRPRENVPLLTAVLSIVSLTLVFGAVGGAIPASLLPHPGTTVITAIPHVNAVISAAAIVTISLGWRAIRRDNVGRHRALMSVSFLFFVTFLTLYLYRLVIAGPTNFEGPGGVVTLAYFAFLAIHILLAIVCIPLLFYALLLAGTRPVSDIYDTAHRRVARIAAPLWLVSFVMGIGVYLLLYQLF